MIANRGEKDTIIVRNILLLSIVLFIAFIAAASYVVSFEKRIADKIYPHVMIDDIDVGLKTRDDARTVFAKRNARIPNATMSIVYNDSPIATFSAQTLGLKTNADEMIDRAYMIGRTERITARLYQKFTSLFGLQTYRFTTSIVYDKSALQDFINGVQDQYEKPAKNALFTFENGRVVNFRKEENGLKLNIDELYKAIDTAVAGLKSKPGDLTITMHDTVVQPEVTLAKANNFGIEELIGEGESNYSHSAPERIDNVILAASKFNGVLIPKDKLFSFDDTIGDISAQTGYKQAYVIKNGKTVLGDGGGVCQVSTTLFRAALNTGLPIEERHAHAYRVYYYENDSKPGFDATIFSPSVDLKVRNNTPAAILIMTEIDKENHILHFRLYGKKDDRKVELSTPEVYNVQPAPPARYEDDPTLKKGVVKQVDFPASGATSRFTYKVSKGDSILTQTTYVSVYQPWQAVFLVGQAD